MQTPIIFWYRQDLRTHDLPGLAAAASSGRPVIPCYILDDHAPGEWATGAASRWWLHHSLVALQAEIASLGGSLVLRRGETLDQLRQLIASTGADTVYCSRQYEPWAAALEKQLHEQWSTADITFKRYAGSLLFEPAQISNQSGLPYKVFTLASGVFGINFGIFVFASILSRGFRFFLIAGLVYKFGTPIERFIDLHFNKLVIFFSVLFVAGFLAIEFFL